MEHQLALFFKKGSVIQLDSILNNALSKDFGVDPAQYAQAINNINSIRQQLQDCTELDLYEQYLRLFKNVKHHFFSDMSHGIVKFQWQWRSSFDSSQKYSSNYAAFEVISVMYNYMASLTHVASQQAEDTSECYKQVGRLLVKAANISKAIRDYRVKHPELGVVPVDLTEHWLKACEFMFLAEAQEAFAKHVSLTRGPAHPLVLGLYWQAVEFYKQACDQFSAAPQSFRAKFPNLFWTHCRCCELILRAEYAIVKADEAQKANEFGDELAWLEQALNSLNTAANITATNPGGQGTTEPHPILLKKAREMLFNLRGRHEKAKVDNDKFFFAQIPEYEDLVFPQPKRLVDEVKGYEIEDIENFQNLLSPRQLQVYNENVTRFQTVYNTYYQQLDQLTTTGRQFLTSKGLGSVVQELPAELKTKLQGVIEKGGYTRIQTIANERNGLRTEVKRLLTNTSQALQSTTAPAEITSEVSGLMSVIAQAEAADKTADDQVMQYIPILSALDQGGIDAVAQNLAQPMIYGDQMQQQRAAMVQGKVKLLLNLFDERTKLLNDVKMEVDGAIEALRNPAKMGEVDMMFNQIDTKLQAVSEQQNNRQNAMISDIEQNHQGGPAQISNPNAQQQHFMLEQFTNIYDSIIGNMNQGLNWYRSFMVRVTDTCERASPYCITTNYQAPGNPMGGLPVFGQQPPYQPGSSS
ncbi:hypothetical protein PCE1_003548 [Barthelona sp. PCE]